MYRQHLYEDTILNLLYSKDGSISTNELHDIVGNLDQAAHNMISNRAEKTNYINKDYINYNKENKTISITNKGREYIENKYFDKR